MPSVTAPAYARIRSGQRPGVPFDSISPLTFRTFLADDKNVAESLPAHIGGLSPAAVEVIERYAPV